MSERYTKLFALSKDLYIDGSPVVISAGALLKDNDQDSVLVQLKFKNICRKVIKAVTVKIIPMDSAGRELGESIEHKFLDISAKRYDEFAQKEPVYLSDNSTRAFSVYVSEVIFDDNSIWSCEDAGWESLPDEEIRFGDNELFKQYRLTYGSYAGKQPVYMNSIWKCTCGFINNSDEDKCQNCNVEIVKLKAFDMEQLKADCSARLEKEEQARQEAKKKAEELKAERELERQRLEADRKVATKKRNKMIVIISGVAAVCIVGAVIVNMVIIPEATYNEAITLIESESYDEAIVLLEKLGTYKDAQQVYLNAKNKKIKSDKYAAACEALENGKYNDAMVEFRSLGEYKDSKELLEKAMKSTLSSLQVGDTLVLGKYNWIVLEKKSDSALILTEECIEKRSFDSGEGTHRWSDCELRKYLNNDFLNKFSDDESAIIQSTKLDDVGTTDKVFLLSRDEAIDLFNTGDNRNSSEERIAYYKGYECAWWLRKCYSGRALIVKEYGSVGSVDYVGEIPDDEYSAIHGVRPAMWISLE